VKMLFSAAKRTNTTLFRSSRTDCWGWFPELPESEIYASYFISNDWLDGSRRNTERCPAGASESADERRCGSGTLMVQPLWQFRVERYAREVLE
jgi:hypothetical protein